MAFCTVSDAGYCRAPRPAAVITALEICKLRRPLPALHERFPFRSVEDFATQIVTVPPSEVRLTSGNAKGQPRLLTRWREHG